MSSKSESDDIVHLADQIKTTLTVILGDLTDSFPDGGNLPPKKKKAERERDLSELLIQLGELSACVSEANFEVAKILGGRYA